MRIGIARILVVSAAGLWLGACSTSSSFSDLLTPKASSNTASDSFAPASTTGGVEANASVPPPLGVPAAAEPPGLLGSDANDDLSLGKKYYRAKNFGIAEKHFRRAVETHPRDAEAWLGLGATYDRMRRFDLADRAYGQAIGIVGPTTEILNNQGYSYMLRGDFRRARTKLAAAQRQDPGNVYVQNNLRLLETSVRKGKMVE